ncbi:hypothetical protein AVEN_41069-1 [Araneus ventricosus]|uniref:Uncharacterized protein n=1 Tax=Araneus ventricosus TaxID=182803 RepID=A0A4Y2CK00_ARAVE|nr:hypothetical protein AVEN_41069-1 [Araneus ventricosus]
MFCHLGGRFWNPRLGWELVWVPHVNNGTQPNRGYQNRPFSLSVRTAPELSAQSCLAVDFTRPTISRMTISRFWLWISAPGVPRGHSYRPIPRTSYFRHDSKSRMFSLPAGRECSAHFVFLLELRKGYPHNRAWSLILQDQPIH